MKHSYQQRVFLYFFAAFALFSVIILTFQYNREKKYRAGQLEATLDNSAEIIHRYVQKHQLSDMSLLDSVIYLIPNTDCRISLIDKTGTVLYDNFIKSNNNIENHLGRPEIQKSLFEGKGSHIRESASTGQDFYYYSRNYGDYFVRCAMVYDLKLINFLKAEKIFILFMAFTFVGIGLILFMMTRRLGEFITKLRDFALRAGRNERIEPETDIHDTEFNEIRQQIVLIYNRLKNTKDDLNLEKERLYRHLHALNEGVAFFSAKKEKILVNSHFIQFINLISEHSTISAEAVFEIGELSSFMEQIELFLSPSYTVNPKDLPQVQVTVSRNEMYFKVIGIVFADKSFEIVIEDMTRPEKRRLLKQQLTSNIAHELKTPLASVKGYLETILNNKEMTSERQQYFVERAFAQSERLNELLNDISLLNNIEDAGDLFEFKDVKLLPLIKDVLENLESRIVRQKMKMEIMVSDMVVVYGNDSLLFSVFQNLMENSIKYAGEGATIRIKQYLEDEKFWYFSYSDSGAGISEEHMPRIFERFYRVDEGRIRSKGGTGLGLSIVKNAINLHKGEISVRNRAEGGLEFLFSLFKHKDSK